MSEEFAVIVCTPDVDGAVAGALAGRAAAGRAEVLVFGSDVVAEFFRPEMQRKLPRGYDLAFCGHSLLALDWDGRPVRPVLMDRLRAAGRPMRWFSGARWAPEDRSAVAHLIGEGNLCVGDGAVTASELVRRTLCAPSDAYAERLVRLARDDLTGRERRAWGDGASRVLAALRADAEQMAAAVGLLMEERDGEMIARFDEAVRRWEEDTRTDARRQAANVRAMGGVRVVLLALEPARHAWWAETSRCAREEAGAELSVCVLKGRHVLLAAADETARLDVEGWIGYVTDMRPGCRLPGGASGGVALHVPGLEHDPRLPEEVLRLLEEGVHLLHG